MLHNSYFAFNGKTSYKYSITEGEAMLAIEKPFPIVPVGAGGLAALAVGFVGSVSLLSILVKQPIPSPASTVSQSAARPANVSVNTSSDPHQYTSSYKDDKGTWQAATAVRSGSVSKTSSTTVASSTPATTQPASSTVAGMGSTTQQVVPTSSPQPASQPTGSTGGPDLTGDGMTGGTTILPSVGDATGTVVGTVGSLVP
jgi:hypothetical protein